MPSPSPTPLLLTATCACTSLSLSLPLPSSLPLPLYLCHCTTCRHLSGSLLTSAIQIPPSTARTLHGRAATYATSPSKRRRFCPVCGTCVFRDSPSDASLYVFSGALESMPGVGVVGPARHIYVRDTRDGGLREWMLRGEAWEGGERESGALQRGVRYEKGTHGGEEEEEERLRAVCHCGGVDFTIGRPGQGGQTTTFTVQPEGKEWSSATATKYLAKVCACTSCRRSAGYDVQAWCYVPVERVRWADGRVMGFKMGTLRRWSGREGVERYFCWRCGATVFWWGGERRDMVDVGVGLLEAGSGARAEGWVEWMRGVSFKEEARDEALVEELDEGMRWADEEKA